MQSGSNEFMLAFNGRMVLSFQLQISTYTTRNRNGKVIEVIRFDNSMGYNNGFQFNGKFGIIEIVVENRWNGVSMDGRQFKVLIQFCFFNF